MVTRTGLTQSCTMLISNENTLIAYNVDRNYANSIIEKMGAHSAVGHIQPTLINAGNRSNVPPNLFTFTGIGNIVCNRLTLIPIMQSMY